MSPETVRADFSRIRYAQVWEDADVLLEALDVRPGDVYVSIASAGDNALALLTRHPARVIAIDVSAQQIACPAAARGRVSRAHARRAARAGWLAAVHPARRARCRPALSTAARAMWDGQSCSDRTRIGGAGKFER